MLSVNIYHDGNAQVTHDSPLQSRDVEKRSIPTKTILSNRPRKQLNANNLRLRQSTWLFGLYKAF